MNQAHIFILLCLGNIYVKAEVWIGGILYLTGELNHMCSVQHKSWVRVTAGRCTCHCQEFAHKKKRKLTDEYG